MLCSFYPVILIIFLQKGYITSLTDWPDGKYGLLKPTTGCPEEWADKDWGSTKVNYWPYYKGSTDRGFIFQVTEETNPNDTSSETLNIDGHIGPSFVMRYFCVKRTNVITSSMKWPQGRYCIYDIYQRRSKKQWGWIKMYDKEHSSYSHAMKYVYDFARDRSNSMILYFSCQTSGNKKIPISLPITKPFYLLPYGSRDCQQVKWMVATTEWIKYHTWNYDGYRYSQRSGTVPYHELGDNNHKGIIMYYCYYESCNYTLAEKKGVFSSPGFPGKYPDGQWCSWRIMVPDNHYLHVRFTNFSLSGNDNLKVYKISRSGLVHLIGMFRFNRNYLLLTATTADLEFVFSSNAGYSSTGFRAQYTVFIPTKITTPSATTTTKPITTTKPTTTTQPTTTTKPPTTTTKSTKTKSPTTKPLQTNNPTITNKPPKPKPQDKTKTNKPTRKITYTTQWSTSNNGASNSFKGSRLFSCDMTLNIVVMVIPLVCSVLVIVLVVDIVYRCRHKKIKLPKSKTNNPRNVDCLAVNMTYERGDIILDQTPDTITDVSTVNTVDDQLESRDELPDYEDVDYTQLNDIPPPRRSSKRQECHSLEPIRTGTSSHAAESVVNGVPEVFYHTLEPTTDLTGPSYQNLFEVNHYTLSPVYESPENSAC